MTKNNNLLYQNFLQHPHLRAFLVFNELNYYGIILKKDFEEFLNQNHTDISSIIIKTPREHLEDLIFNVPPKVNMKIPYTNLRGEILGALLYDEFVSEFFTEDFQTKFSLSEVFEYYENPIMILNQFKTILYMNQASKDLLSKQVLGCKISDALLAFQINTDNNDHMIISRQEDTWYFQISRSMTPYATYYIYQFIKKLS